MTIRKIKGIENQFSIVPNETINDSLSWGAKGLLVYLCSKPDDWEVSVAQLVNHSKESAKPTGRDGTYTIINELIEKGYIQRIQKKGDGGKFSGSEYLVSSTPLEPFTDNPHTDSPLAAEPTQQSKDNNKEQIEQTSLVPAKPKRSKFKYDPRDLECAKQMCERVEIINPAMKKPNLESWANTIRLMREVDHRTYEQIWHTFDWANKDSFWYKNILSPEKLRKQFDKLQVRINETGNGNCQSGGGNNGNGLSHTQQQIAAARARAQSGERAASVEPMGNDGGDILDLDQSQWRHAEPPMGDGDFFIDG